MRKIADSTIETPLAKPSKNRASRKKTAKKAHTPPVEVYLQISGQEYDCAALVEAARSAYRNTHKTGIHTCRVSTNQDEQSANHVINKVEGKIGIAPVTE